MDSANIPRIRPTAEPFLFQGNQTGCLLVHGFTGSPREMRLLGEHLRPYGWTVLGIRLAGHATRPEDMERCSWEDWLLSVEDGLHLLRDSCAKVFIIGLSMGGMLSMIAAARWPVEGLVAISTPYRMPKDWRLKYMHILKYFSREVGKGRSDWHNPANAVGHTSYSTYPTKSIIELSKVIDEMHKAVTLIKTPTLLVQSRHDGTVPEEHVHLHYNDLRVVEKHILMVEDSGHNIPRDSDREIVFQNIVEFIQKHIDS